jgi:hypothetical protein
VLAGCQLAHIVELTQALSAEGIQLQWQWQDTRDALRTALKGAALAGGITALVTKDADAAMWAALAGGLAGAAISIRRSYRAALHGTEQLRVLALEAG